jgi:hypothetical protein
MEMSISLTTGAVRKDLEALANLTLRPSYHAFQACPLGKELHADNTVFLLAGEMFKGLSWRLMFLIVLFLFYRSVRI